MRPSLCQLSYAAIPIAECRFRIADCTQNSEIIQKILTRQESVIEKNAQQDKTLEELERRIRDIEKFQYNFSSGLRRDQSVP